MGAHHASVENNFLSNVWPYPKASPDFLNPNSSQTSWGPWIDSHRLYSNLFKNQQSYKLESLITDFGLTLKLKSLAEKYCPDKRRKYHCALYDALASALLIQHLCSYSEIQPLTLEWLIINSAGNELRRKELDQRTFDF